MSEPNERIDNAPISIHSLPPELLDVIFEYLYVLSRPHVPDPGSQVVSKSKQDLASHTTAQKHKDPTSPSFFPYAQAHVCRQWRETLSKRTYFWDHIVFFIHGTPLAALQDYLRYAGDCELLDLTVSCKGRMSTSKTLITTSKNPIKTLGIYEASQVAKVMHVLKTGHYIRRLRSIHFHVRRVSSLPRVSSFYNIPRQLTSLVLKANNAVGVSFASQEFDKNLYASVYFRVKSLTIDGPNFIELVRHVTRMQNSLGGLYGLEALSISKLCNTSQPTLSMFETLFTIRMAYRLKFLKIEDICFSLEDRRLLTLTPIQSHITDVELVGLEAEPLAMLFKLLSFPADRRSLKIKHCDPGLVSRFPMFPYLILEGYSDFGRTWSGRSITFIDCPGITDDFLLRMATLRIHWVELVLDQCNEFSVPGLKLFLHRRTHPDFVPMDSIRVHRCATVISEEDRAWFRRFLVEFEWTAF